ncbi:substrate-binding periplasmic protein [Maridesulfovibrio salexigens]|uniref:Extracellular solute-binding protein family 3 n=1 Tax=Maridesulfovibrio salexigens (strain ATCC 14822 / DSM 2638 / NCIMB 8403 / VKM B-1763) TaxID=526222 RepID=C6BZK4_MARSD|nr:transporter substrate-binding domain-containing protein [Maridesulfovibrio salexigens]ACS80841.1 extracellular solute-binding protein family 3 [Maridesulfovibrio salexigens DSM 2638]
MSVRRFKIFFATMLLLLGIGVASAGADNVIYLSSLEWPPYVGKRLPESGTSARIVSQAFAAMGYELKILFMPWKRTMRMVETDFMVAGYFPEYYSKERAEKYIFSKSYGCSPVSLLVRKKNPVNWRSVDDLAGLRVGFVAGYVNTPELDMAVFNGTIDADYAPSDKSNIMKVIKGRIDCAVIDPLVFSYLAVTDQEVGKRSDTVEIDPRAFGVNELFVAFRKDEQGLFYSRILNEGLSKIGIAGACKQRD